MENYTAVYKSPAGHLYITVNRNKKLISAKWNYPDCSDIKYSPEYHENIFLQLDEYFSGTRKVFNIETDINALPGFYRKILNKLSEIPYGKTITYQELAERAGAPGASRAAGSAMKRNPIAVIIPCHRVINKSCIKKNGIIPGNYTGGIDKKIHLLKLEGNNIIFNGDKT